MHPDGTAIQESETFIPERLLRFLVDLEGVTATTEVWDLLVETAARMSLPFVEYTYATDFRNPHRPRFVHTTLEGAWLGWSEVCPDRRETVSFEGHGYEYLTPVTLGVSYFETMGTISAECRQHLMMAAQLGIDAAVAFPLRTGIEGQAAMLSFGGRYTRAEFDDLLTRNGWTLHAMAQSAHLRYTELLKGEIVAQFGLTRKQKELVSLVGLGMMDKQIAHTLGISFSAVRQRLATVQQKTGAQNRADLAALSVRLDLVPDPLLRDQEGQVTINLANRSAAAASIELRHAETDRTAADDTPRD